MQKFILWSRKVYRSYLNKILQPFGLGDQENRLSYQRKAIFLILALTLLDGVLLTGFCLAEEDSLTITTYYPSPYGSYNELDTRTLWFGHEINGRIGFNYPATSTDYNRRLRITAGRNDTFDNTQGASIDLHGNNYTDISGMRGRLDLVAGTAAEGNITFWTGNPVNERMRITREGRVGIGTRNPMAVLEVNNTVIYTPRAGNPATDWGTGHAGELAYSSQKGSFYYSNGSSWVAQGGGGGGGCYVSYSGGCLGGFINKGSAGSWGYCSDSGHFRPPGGGCNSVGYSHHIGEAFVCCQ